MRTEIQREFRFEAAHRLPKLPSTHKCARMHGHGFRVTVVVGGEVDPELGWIVDFAALDEAWRPFHEMLDHRSLNDVPGLENPTSEVLGAFIATRFKAPAPATLKSVTVHETCAASCTVYV